MKLTHLEHIEDNLMQYPEQVLQTLYEIGRNKANMSLKWDGAPAIIFGTDPFKDKFFLSTKSLFNKTPKVNYSCEDIMLNHGDNYPLACKLMYAFTLLKENYTDGSIVQADMLFCKSEIDYSNEFPRFTPNTLTYEARSGTDVSNALLGLVVHTTYKFTDYGSTSLQDMSAFPYNYKGSMGDKIWIARTEVDYENVLNIQLGMNTRVDAVNHVKWLIENRDEQFIQAKILATEVYADYKIFFNSCIRNQDYETGRNVFDIHWKRFVDWSIDRTATQIKKLKTPAAMKNHLYDLDARLVLLHDPKVMTHFRNMCMVREYIKAFKTDLCRSLQNVGPVLALFEGDRCGHEGYVVTNTSGTMMKIVQRREFSARNFNKNGNNFQK